MKGTWEESSRQSEKTHKDVEEKRGHLNVQGSGREVAGGQTLLGPTGDFALEGS